MTPSPRDAALSKFLSFILRHHPETIGLHLDAQGWADVETLLRLMNAHDRTIDRALLEHIVATNNKKRFAFNADGTKIRASQGHSIAIDLAYTPREPPEMLYHGTAAATVAAIFASGGLEKRARQHVHLSADPDTAVKVGQRHGKPVVLRVLAGQMQRDGFLFYRSDNGVWLTDHVPAAYLQQL